MLQCMIDLKTGKAVEIPVYDFKRHQRDSQTRKVNPADVVIMEGILVFHDPTVRSHFNMKIFVDTGGSPSINVVRIGNSIFNKV